MNSNAKSKIIILLALGTLFALSPVITTDLSFTTGNTNKSSEYSDDISLDNKNLKISAISGKIHIDNNWTAAKIAGICTGNGTYSEPYVIEDWVIDGEGSGSCILIENSDVYFRIENCSVYNSKSYLLIRSHGIRLSNVNNSLITTNNCSSNYYGIHIYNGENNTVSGNTANNNYHGIYLSGSNNNTISGNTANNNRYGIYLYTSYYNIISGNIMNECGLGLSINLEMLTSLIIDITNLVNGKPLYFYLNEINLGPNNFTNAGQVILVNCNNSLSLYYCDNNTILGNTANNNSFGIYLIHSNNNTISGNTANNNFYGISLYTSYYNLISGNTANNNSYGIYLIHSNNNTISGNTANDNSNKGIYLLSCVNNTISGNTANNNSFGIYLSTSDYNTISGNIANNNSYGVYLYFSDYNTISGNSLIGNDKCIKENNCEGNEFSDNGACTYGQGDGIIPGYNLFFILSILSIVAIILSKRLKKS
jgi:parallel beta-helix repeat protein